MMIGEKLHNSHIYAFTVILTFFMFYCPVVMT
jgi:hypothetical protein